MKIHQVVGFVGDLSSGPAHSVPALCHALVDNGINVVLEVNENFGLTNVPFTINEYGRWKLTGGMYVSPKMLKGLRTAAKSGDIIHSHGMWTMPYIYPGWAIHRTKCKLVVAPRGNFGNFPLRVSRRRKQIVWHLWQKKVLKSASCIHATCEAEYKEVRAMGIHVPVAIVPNGIDIPDLPVNWKERRNSARRRLSFLSKDHAKKGIEFLIKSWVEIEDRFPEWELQIVGPLDSKYADDMQALAVKMNAERLFFPDEKTGDEKAELYLSSDLFVLPTHHENFGMVVAEALSYCVPAIVTKGAPWSGLQHNNCGDWIDLNNLTDSLIKHMSKSRNDLIQMGQSGREWMKRDFTWNRVGEMLEETYEWLIYDKKQPTWTILE